MPARRAFDRLQRRAATLNRQLGGEGWGGWGHTSDKAEMDAMENLTDAESEDHAPLGGIAPRLSVAALGSSSYTWFHVFLRAEQ